MANKTSKVRVYRYLSELIIVPRDWTRVYTALWLNKKQKINADVDDIELLSLTDWVFVGRKKIQVSAIVEKEDFESVEDLPILV